MINKKILSVSGMVISVTPYKETSAICSIITSSGLNSIFVRNAYKANNSLKPLLIPFNYLKVDYYQVDDKLLIAKECVVIKDYSILITSYKNNLFLQCIIQLITFLFNYNVSFNIDSLLSILNYVKENKNLLSLLILFIGSIYSDLGLKQNTSSCVLCSKTKNIVSFSLDEGGYICTDCQNKNNKYQVKNNNELFLYKFTFSNIDDKTSSANVPVIEGCKILSELSRYLESYFDISRLTSVDNFINYLSSVK